MSSTSVLSAISALAAGQWGLLTTAQAEREGVTRVQLARLVDAGVLDRVDRGVYATTASPAEHRTLRAAWLVLEPGLTAEERLSDPIATGVVSHTSAAGLHGLGDLLDDVPEVTVSKRKQTRRGIRVHHLPLTEDDVTLVDGLPTTTEKRTVVDLLRDGHDMEHVAQILGQAARRGGIDLDDLASRLDPLARRRGAASGRALLEQLLDLVGLSPAALVRDLAESRAGRDLIAAGQYAGASAALSRVLAEILSPYSEIGRSIAADHSAMDGVAQNVRKLQPGWVSPSVTEDLSSVLSAIRLSVFPDLDLPGLRTALAAQAPPSAAAQPPPQGISRRISASGTKDQTVAAAVGERSGMSADDEGGAE